MKQINTAEATGPALDWLVAKIEGLDPEIYGGRVWQGTKRPFNPSTDWSQGGPIIHRERIDLKFINDVCYAGTFINRVVDGRTIGPTPLIAAMRCFVTSKLGDTVEVPEELL